MSISMCANNNELAIIFIESPASQNEPGGQLQRTPLGKP
jgi:hypothetical protein